MTIRAICVICLIRDSDNFRSLLHNHHPPRRRKIARSELVEIDTARHRLTYSIPTIPIRRTVTALIEPRRLMPQVQLPHHHALCVINREFYIGGVGEVIRNPCLRVERIRIVGQQYRHFRDQRR